MITTLRKEQSRLPRTVLAMSAVLWLSLMLQPCATALPVTSDAPVLDNANDNDRYNVSLAEHRAADGNRPDCAVHGAACCDGNSDCDGCGARERGVVSKVKDLSSDFSAISPATWFRVNVNQQSAATDVVLHVEPPPARVPVNILFCVYLK
ncbi:MAG: hypothetical protein ACE5OQ_02680 [Woeseia sp.]